MKPILSIITFIIAAACNAAEYTYTSARLRGVEGQWASMGGTVYSFNTSHAWQPGGKVSLDIAEYHRAPGDSWYSANWWDLLNYPEDLQLGWPAWKIQTMDLAYLVKVTINNGWAGYFPTGPSTAMFSLSVEDNVAYHWYEYAAQPPPVGAAWAVYRISCYSSAPVIGVTLVGWGTASQPSPDIGAATPPPGYFN